MVFLVEMGKADWDKVVFEYRSESVSNAGSLWESSAYDSALMWVLMSVMTAGEDTVCNFGYCRECSWWVQIAMDLVDHMIDCLHLRRLCCARAVYKLGLKSHWQNSGLCSEGMDIDFRLGTM